MPSAALLEARTVAKSDLPFLSSSNLVRHSAAVNTAYARARAQFEQATEALGDLITEQIVRVTGEVFPGAAKVLAGPVRGQDTGGVWERLVPSAVLGTGGQVVGFIEPMSPLHYLYERLTPHLGLRDCELDLVARTWEFPA